MNKREKDLFINLKPHLKSDSSEVNAQPQSMLSAERANELFLETMSNVAKSQTNEERFNLHFTYHENDLSLLEGFISRFEDKKKISNNNEEKGGYTLKIPTMVDFLNIMFEEKKDQPKTYTEDELRELLGEKYMWVLGQERGWGSLNRDAFQIDDLTLPESKTYGHVAIGEKKINLKNSDTDSNSFLIIKARDYLAKLSQSDRFQLIVAHEVGHFVQHVKKLNNLLPTEKFDNSHIDFTASSQPRLSVEMLTKFFNQNHQLGVAKEASVVPLLTDYCCALARTSQEMYSDCFSLLMSQKNQNFRLTLSEAAHALLDARGDSLSPVIVSNDPGLNLDDFFKKSGQKNTVAVPERVKVLGDITYNTDYAISYLTRSVLNKNVSELSLTQIHAQCQDAMIYGLTQIIYETTLTENTYGNLIKKVHIQSEQPSLFGQQPQLSDVFNILSEEDKNETQKRVASYERIIEKYPQSPQNTLKELYCEEIKAKTSIYSSSDNSENKPLCEPCEQLSLVDKIAKTREMIQLDRLGQSEPLYAPKPISFKS